MISGHGTIETAVRATKLGAFDFLEKPLSLERTLITIKNAVEKRQLRADNRELIINLTTGPGGRYVPSDDDRALPARGRPLGFFLDDRNLAVPHLVAKGEVATDPDSFTF